MNSFTNYIMYDENSYDYPSYITIDGFSNNYEYALIDKDNLKIIYIYLVYPDIKNEKYTGYLKKNKKIYLIVIQFIDIHLIIIILIMNLMIAIKNK